MRDERQQAPDDKGGRYKWLVLFTVVFGAFASILDSTIVNTALPKIQAIFHADLHEASYVATGYTLAAGVVVPATGYLSNRFGSKRIYLGSLALFTIGSVLCGFAPNMTLLIAFRVLQGAGGAALFPLSFAMLFAAFPEEQRGLANGVFGIPILVAPAIGPTLGGYIVQYIDWRWIFFVNLPVGIIGVLAGWRVLRAEAGKTNLRFDLPGFLLAASGLGLLLYGLSNLAYDGLNSVGTVSGPIGIAIVLLIAFIVFDLRRDQPLLDLRLYGRRNFAVGNVIAWLATVGLFGPAFLLPQYLQVLRGQTPFQAGLLLLWQGIGSMIGTILSGQLYNRIGRRILMLFGAVDMVVTGYLLSRWATPASDLGLLAWILLPRGFGLPMLLQSTGTATLDGITGRALPGATTLNVVGRNVIASLSIAVLTNILRQRATDHIAALSKGAAHGASHIAFGNGGHLPKIVVDGTALAFQDVFIITAIVILPAIPLAFMFRNIGRGQPPGGGGKSEDKATRPKPAAV